MAMEYKVDTASLFKMIEKTGFWYLSVSWNFEKKQLSAEDFKTFKDFSLIDLCLNLACLELREES